MPRISLDSERDYVASRLRPLLDRLREDRELREEFLHFAVGRGGDTALMVQRLKKAWWESRTPQFAPFFTLTLTEFGFARGILKPSLRGARPKVRPTKTD